MITEIDASLQRLGVDHVDLYQIHRWDYATPIEETLEALHDVVKAGKARYIGASSMFAWQFAKALAIWVRSGSVRGVFVSLAGPDGAAVADDSAGYSGNALLAMAGSSEPLPEQLRELRRLFRELISQHLRGEPLQSWGLMAGLNR